MLPYKHPYPLKNGIWRGGVVLKFHFKILFLQSCLLNDQYSSSFHVIGKQMKIKYLRLAPEELSASMMTAAQFLEGCHPYICAASVWHVLSSGAKRKYLIFICLPMTWNDEAYWSLRKHDCKNGILKWNFSTTPPSNFIFKRVGITAGYDYIYW